MLKVLKRDQTSDKLFDMFISLAQRYRLIMTLHKHDKSGNGRWPPLSNHELYGDVIMSATASQITSLTIVYPIVYSGANQRKQQTSASLAFVRGMQRWPVNSPHKGPVTRKIFPCDDVIIRMNKLCLKYWFKTYLETAHWNPTITHTSSQIVLKFCTKLSITAMLWGKCSSDWTINKAMDK